MIVTLGERTVASAKMIDAGNMHHELEGLRDGMGPGYLTSGQVAGLLGVSKRTVLRAVESGTLHAACKMPGGASRFIPPDVEQYAQHLRLRERMRASAEASARDEAVLGKSAPGASAGHGQPIPAIPLPAAASRDASSRPPVVSGLEQLSLLSTGGQNNAQEDTTNILTLVADSLRVGATCLARVVDGRLQIEQLYDRVGMGLRAGDPVPCSAVYEQGLDDSNTPVLIVEDVRADVRFAANAVSSDWRAGAVTVVPISWTDGRLYGALCTFHPHARHVPSGETALLRLAGRMVMQAAETAATREREREWARKLARLAATVEASDDAIFSIDVSGRIESWNPGAAHVYGYSADEIVGRPYAVLASLEYAAEASSMVQRATCGEHLVHYETIRLRKDGSLVHVALTASPIRNDDGTVIGVSVIARDITAVVQARAAAEELARLRQQQVEEAEAMSAVGSALAGTLEPSRLYDVILEQAERILRCDHSCVLLYEDGWATVAASRGVALQPDGTRAFPVEAIESVMAYGLSGRPALVADTAAIHWIDVPPLVGQFAIRSSILVPLVLDGTVVGTFNVDSFTPNFYSGQHLARAVALGERVTQALRNVHLYQLEQRRARAAEELARLKDDFVASVSHELRTPLTAVLGYAEILEARWQHLEDPSKLEHVRRIVRAANRQRRLVEDLLLLSSLEQRELAPRPMAVGVNELLRQARDEVQGIYQGQRIEFDECCAVQVLADPGGAIRVLVNLLDNAAKYSPVGCPVVVVSSVENGMAVVRVRDYGPGVPEEGRERLFARFSRVVGSRTRAGRVGTGLGLHLSRRLANQMGGDLDLETTGPQGSTFRLRLRVAPAQAQAGTPDA